MKSKIKLKELKFYAYHGVLPQETLVGNNYIINVTLTVPLVKAMFNDNLNDTINYAAVYNIIKQEMAVPSKLLEHVAGRILHSLKHHFPQLIEVKLSVSKLNPPLGGDIYSASVILEETYLAENETG
ncbi:MAG: dihydroneopterin aldolase [Tannerellaceae bacterium]|jgi:dihydroneopterin aldolase|nr:dihydroneopterin aldolase [Tannerellaceae bacterium]